MPWIVHYFKSKRNGIKLHPLKAINELSTYHADDRSMISSETRKAWIVIENIRTKFREYLMKFSMKSNQKLHSELILS